MTETDAEILKRKWKPNRKPLRRILLWIIDENNNPGFLAFYGYQNFTGKTVTISNQYGSLTNEEFSSSEYHILEDEVKYEYMGIWKGVGGHLPTLRSGVVFADEKKKWNSTERKYDILSTKYYLVKKKIGSRYYSYYNKKYIDLTKLEDKYCLKIPYFDNFDVDLIFEQVSKIQNFPEGIRIVNSPNEVLKFQSIDVKFIEIINKMIVKERLYTRIKFLNELLDLNPPKEVLLRLIEIGSSELIGGIILAYAKRSNPEMEKKANAMLTYDFEWLSKNISDGLKRVIKIYLNTLNPNLKENRINELKKEIENPNFYQLKKLEKGIIQEADIYDIPDVIGKMAYYLDSPKLISTYHKVPKYGSEDRYLIRYLKRIIDDYADTDEEKFTEAIKMLLISYQHDDYLSKFKGNFKFNKILKFYAFHRFDGKPPTIEMGSYGSYFYPENEYERNRYFREDQLAKLEGRYEYRPDIWDKHLDKVVEIALNSHISHVKSFCYYIFKESSNFEEFIKKTSLNIILKLAKDSDYRISSMFKEIAKLRIEKTSEFDPKIAVPLMTSEDPEFQSWFRSYKELTNGKISAEIIADLILSENPTQWAKDIITWLDELIGEEYATFMERILSQLYEISKKNKILDDNINIILQNSTEKINQISETKKVELLQLISDALSEDIDYPKWILDYMQNLIFAIPYEELKSLIQRIKLKALIYGRTDDVKMIVKLLSIIESGDLPRDVDINLILQKGSSNAIKTMITIIRINQDKLLERIKTILLLLESKLVSLNHLAIDQFGRLSEENKNELLKLLIDSPELNASDFAISKLDELYGEKIPLEFITRMLEHVNPKIQAYISGKINEAIKDIGSSNPELFLYYAKSLILIPNRISKAKDRIYKLLPTFIKNNKIKKPEVEFLLLEVGGSNIILDSERALVALAKIRLEGN